MRLLCAWQLKSTDSLSSPLSFTHILSTSAPECCVSLGCLYQRVSSYQLCSPVSSLFCRWQDAGTVAGTHRPHFAIILTCGHLNSVFKARQRQLLLGSLPRGEMHPGFTALCTEYSDVTASISLVWCGSVDKNRFSLCVRFALNPPWSSCARPD